MLSHRRSTQYHCGSSQPITSHHQYSFIELVSQTDSVAISSFPESGVSQDPSSGLWQCSSVLQAFLRSPSYPQIRMTSPVFLAARALCRRPLQTFFPYVSPSLCNPILLCKSLSANAFHGILSPSASRASPLASSATAQSSLLNGVKQQTYLKPASIVSFVLRPISFSSRLMRIAAAETPMNSANRGSPIREMRCVGTIGGIVLWELRTFAYRNALL
jgi:hypothetical protein